MPSRFLNAQLCAVVACVEVLRAEIYGVGANGDSVPDRVVVVWGVQLMFNLAGASVAAVTSAYRAVLDVQERGKLPDVSARRSLVRAAFARGLFVLAVERSIAIHTAIFSSERAFGRASLIRPRSFIATRRRF